MPVVLEDGEDEIVLGFSEVVEDAGGELWVGGIKVVVVDEGVGVLETESIEVDEDGIAVADEGVDAGVVLVEGVFVLVIVDASVGVRGVPVGSPEVVNIVVVEKTVVVALGARLTVTKMVLNIVVVKTPVMVIVVVTSMLVVEVLVVVTPIGPCRLDCR
jgi:hypothetical protein